MKQETVLLFEHAEIQRTISNLHVLSF